MLELAIGVAHDQDCLDQVARTQVAGASRDRKGMIIAGMKPGMSPWLTTTLPISRLQLLDNTHQRIATLAGAATRGIPEREDDGKQETSSFSSFDCPSNVEFVRQG